MTRSRPLPDVNKLNRPYWDGARQNQLLVQRCNECGRCSLPARSWCPFCYSRGLEWTGACGKGTVMSFSHLYITPFDGYVAEFPYVLAVIRLDEGPQMMANIINSQLERIQIGAAVKVVFERRSDEVVVPQFQLDEKEIS